MVDVDLAAITQVGAVSHPLSATEEAAVLSAHLLGQATGGNVHYVLSSGTPGDGFSPDSIKTTIDAAINDCAAGDTIIVLPGHAETISAAAGIDADVAGISIIGVGHGSRQPSVTLGTATTTDIDIDAAGILIENIHFIAGFADVAAAIDVNADDFTIRRCRFTEATNLNFVICIQDAAATASDRITVEECEAICPDAANTHFINLAGTGEGHKIVRNILQGDWGTMAVGGAGVVTHCVIMNNVIANAASTSDACINLAATATGIVVGNDCAGAAVQANGITATACLVSRNYYGVISEDLSAILDPIAT